MANLKDSRTPLGPNEEYEIDAVDAGKQIDFYLCEKDHLCGKWIGGVKKEDLQKVLLRQAIQDFAGLKRPQLPRFRTDSNSDLVGVFAWKSWIHQGIKNIAWRIVYKNTMEELDGHRLRAEAVDIIARELAQASSFYGWAEKAAKDAVEILTAEAEILKEPYNPEE